jgi:hypothetical protein
MYVLYSIGAFLTVLIVAIIIRLITDSKLPFEMEQLPWKGMPGRIKLAYVQAYHKVLYYLILVFGVLEALVGAAIVIAIILWCFGIRG